MIELEFSIQGDTYKLAAVVSATAVRYMGRVGSNAFSNQNMSGVEQSHQKAMLKALTSELLKYGQGQLRNFSVKVEVVGTDFQQRCWGEIEKIPYGETRSYRWLANRVGNPKALRAVARACAQNPVPLLIPCHRVISSSGSLGGYNMGVELKQKLLQLESSEATRPEGVRCAQALRSE